VTRLLRAQPWFDEHPEARVYPVFHVIRASPQRQVVSGQPLNPATPSGSRRWPGEMEPQRSFGSPIYAMSPWTSLCGFRRARRAHLGLDENSFEAAIADPSAADGQGSFEGEGLSLGPYAVARLILQA
jgi:hypothetical protein